MDSKVKYNGFSKVLVNIYHGLQTPSEENTFTAWPKINSQSQTFSYSQSKFCLPHPSKFSDFFDLSLLCESISIVHWETWDQRSCNDFNPYCLAYNYVNQKGFKANTKGSEPGLFLRDLRHRNFFGSHGRSLRFGISSFILLLSLSSFQLFKVKTTLFE